MKLTYSNEQQTIMAAVIEVLQENNGSATLAEIYRKLPEKTGKKLNEQTAKEVYGLLGTSSADNCIFINGEERCLYVTEQGNGDYVVEVNPDVKPGDRDDATAGQPGTEAGEPELKSQPEGDLVMDNADNATIITEPYESSEASDAPKTTEKPVEDTKAVEAADEAADKFDYDEAKKAELASEDQRDIDRDQAVIDKEEAKIVKHEEQIAKDKTRLMKDIHEMEIHHDEHVIAGEKADMLEKQLEEKDLK